MSFPTYPAPIPPGSPVQPASPIQFAGEPLALHISHKPHVGFPSPAADYKRFDQDTVRLRQRYRYSSLGGTLEHVTSHYKTDEAALPHVG
ncbi:hypothetical protein HBH1_03233 [Herbaspirillum sp. BH-1]|nr:hypothetical protein HBH1_03233 [Herbaspirillum sp. BH-1]